MSVWCANSPAMNDTDEEEVTGWVYTGNSSEGLPVCGLPCQRIKKGFG